MKWTFDLWFWFSSFYFCTHACHQHKGQIANNINIKSPWSKDELLGSTCMCVSTFDMFSKPYNGSFNSTYAQKVHWYCSTYSYIYFALKAAGLHMYKTSCAVLIIHWEFAHEQDEKTESEQIWVHRKIRVSRKSLILPTECE